MTTDTQIPLPAEAPIMVLPGCVLFPGIMLPLRIFESRYRTMIEWALEHDRMFCIATMKPGIEEAETINQFHHVAGLGLISASKTQSDGTSNLLLQGCGRIRFTDFVQLEPFRIARLEPIPSILGDAGTNEIIALELRGLCTRLCASHESAEDFEENLSKIGDLALLADFVASTFIRDAGQRQRLLEEPHVTTRLDSLTACLRQELDPS